MQPSLRHRHRHSGVLVPHAPLGAAITAHAAPRPPDQIAWSSTAKKWQAVPVLLALLYWYLAGHPDVDPALGALSVVAASGILLFAINVWRTLPGAK